MAFATDKGDEPGQELPCVVPGRDPPSPTQVLGMATAIAGPREHRGGLGLQHSSDTAEARGKALAVEAYPPAPLRVLFILTI